MTKLTHVWTVVLALLVVIGTAGVVAASHTGGIELEAAESGDSDTTTLSYTFTASGNGTATVDPTSDSQSGGDVIFTLTSASSFTVEAGESYTVEYEVTAEDGASEGTYDLFSTVNGPAGTYSETLSVDVDILEPQFGLISSQNGEVIFTTDSTESTTIEVDVDNTGDGVMKGVSASVSGVPSGMEVDVSTPNEISAGGTETVDVEVTADASLSEGDYDFTVGLTDSLSNSESFTVSVDVVKVPVLSAQDQSVDLGDVLINNSVSTDFVIKEVGGYESAGSVEVTVEDSDPSGALSINGIGGFISAGGSDDGTATIEADPDASQYADLFWDVSFQPDDPQDIGTSVTFSARVIYPPYYESVTAEDQTIVFDEPRTRRSEFSTTVPVTIENGGDLPMQVTDISPRIIGSGLSASVAGSLDLVPPRSSRTVNINVAADTDANEGPQALTVNVTAATSGSRSTAATVTVDHESELAVETTDVQYGRVVATRSVTRSIGISERLGYQGIQNFSITKISGPNKGWLTVTEQPESLSAGGSAPFITSITFDTRAQFFTEYTWEYRVSGNNVDPSIIIITATPRPIDFAATVESLRTAANAGDSSQQVVAAETADAMEDLATLLRENSSQAARSDVVTVSAAGGSTMLFIGYINDAQAQIESGNRSAAQRSLTRAAATYNTLETASKRVQTPEIREKLRRAADSADSTLAELLENQRSYYQEQLSADETTTLERAQTYRQIAQLAALAGNEAEAADLRSQSQAAFEEYSILINDGKNNLRQARQERSNLTSGTLISFEESPVFWIGNLDNVEQQENEITDAYTRAEEQFASAGAKSQAATARAEREEYEELMDRGRLISFGFASVVTLLFVLILGLEIRAVYRYLQDSREAVSGDFLLVDDTA